MGTPEGGIVIRRKTGPDRGTVEHVRWRDRDKCRRCQGIGEQIHHRKPRGMGGTRDPAINSMSNLVLLCQTCHGWIEQHRTQARELGWLVSQHADPIDIPVDTFHGLIRLLPDGTTIPYSQKETA